MEEVEDSNDRLDFPVAALQSQTEKDLSKDLVTRDGRFGMEQIKNSPGEDDAATDKEEVKNVRETETEDEVESPAGSSALHIDVNPPVAPPRKEKRKEVREKKQPHSVNGPPGPIPKIFTQDTFTAWEKKPPSKEGRKVLPPRFSRLLSSLSEERLASQVLLLQQKSEMAMEPSEEELENIVPRPSLQEHLVAQNRGVPVNFSALSLHQPQQIPAVETVEAELTRLEDLVPSTSRDAENPTVQPTPSSVEPNKEDLPQAPIRRTATMHSVHSKLLLPRDSVTSVTGTFPSVWSMGQRISHWRLAHQHGYHIDQLTQDKVQKSTIMRHERDTKAAVPLPLQEVIEEEALEILKETLKAYQRYLGVSNHLTLQLEERAEKLHLRLKGRGVID